MKQRASTAGAALRMAQLNLQSVVWNGISMQKINILGVELTDYSLKESLILMEKCMGSGRLSTILYVTAPMLMLAGRDEEKKNCIESIDLTLCGDSELLRVSGIESVSRQYEVENQMFLKEFLRRMVREERTIYLLAESEEGLDSLRRELRRFQSGLFIEGSSVVSDETEDMGEIINRINDVAPAAVVSRLPHGRQEQYMMQFKPFINAEVWLGISADMVLGTVRNPLHQRIKDLMYKKIFRRELSRFKDENGE